MFELDIDVVRIPTGAIIFSFFQNIEPDAEAKPASYSMVKRSLQEVKWPGSGSDHPPPPRAEFKERMEL